MSSIAWRKQARSPSPRRRGCPRRSSACSAMRQRRVPAPRPSPKPSGAASRRASSKRWCPSPEFGMREPAFWRRGGNPWPARLLAPAGWIYGAATVLRRRVHRPYRAPVPVVVAGGLTLGGAGKTPLAIALAERLAGRHPHFLSRGYGGREAGPLRVDPARHDATDVGDEPLLLAAAAPAWVARDRPAGAREAAAAGAGLIILDDGFQNPFLAKDLALLAIDGESGIG